MLSKKVEELFEQHCKQNKISPTQRKMNLRKLNKLSSNEEVQIKIIQRSLDRNWRGLYPLMDEYIIFTTFLYRFGTAIPNQIIATRKDGENYKSKNN